MSTIDQNTKDSRIMIPENEMTIAGEKFIIKPFVIRNRTKVLKIVADVFAMVANKPNLKDIPNIDLLTEVVMTGSEKLIEIYEMVLGKDKEWILDNVTIPDEIQLAQIIWEINKFPLLQSQFLKMLAQFTKKQQ